MTIKDSDCNKEIGVDGQPQPTSYPFPDPLRCSWSPRASFWLPGTGARLELMVQNGPRFRQFQGGELLIQRWETGSPRTTPSLCSPFSPIPRQSEEPTKKPLPLPCQSLPTTDEGGERERERDPLKPKNRLAGATGRPIIIPKYNHFLWKFKNIYYYNIMTSWNPC